MMKREAVYKRELNHSYMVLACSGEELAERYDYRIMMHNRIGRLLPCSLRQMDGEDFLYYEISSKQPLERLYEGGKLKAADLAYIIREIAAVQTDLGEYMLDESGLLLEEGMIFADVETRELYFAFYPGSRSAESQYGGLADFFLGHTDHGQEQAVNLAYEFYRMSKADYFVLSSFLPLLEKELAAVKTGWGTQEDPDRRGGETAGRTSEETERTAGENGWMSEAAETGGSSFLLPEDRRNGWKKLPERKRTEKLACLSGCCHFCKGRRSREQSRRRQRNGPTWCGTAMSSSFTKTAVRRRYILRIWIRGRLLSKNRCV